MVRYILHMGSCDPTITVCNTISSCVITSKHIGIHVAIGKCSSFAVVKIQLQII